jgi:hypothetical protein
MSSSITKLLSLSDELLIKTEVETNADNSLTNSLLMMLSEKNGFYAFESALHVFPLGKKKGVMDIESWNSADVWKSAYGNLATPFFCFAEDIFGMQFCIYEDIICLFDAETAHYEVIASTLEEWAEKILEDYNVLTGYPIAHQWQQKYDRIPEGYRLFPKMPFVGGGSFDINNLYVADMVEGMKARGSIAQQIHDLPDGTKIEFAIVE